jgi:hypothetical protein
VFKEQQQDFYVETTTLHAGATPRFSFFSNADCVIEVFNIRNTATITTEKATKQYRL